MALNWTAAGFRIPLEEAVPSPAALVAGSTDLVEAQRLLKATQAVVTQVRLDFRGCASAISEPREGGSPMKREGVSPMKKEAVTDGVRESVMNGWLIKNGGWQEPPVRLFAAAESDPRLALVAVQKVSSAAPKLRVETMTPLSSQTILQLGLEAGQALDPTG